LPSGFAKTAQSMKDTECGSRIDGTAVECEAFSGGKDVCP
jgi:hypothetical protein